MIYGINTRKSVLLSDIARGLQETTKLAYTIDRISEHLNNMVEETEIEIRKNYIRYTREILRMENNTWFIVYNVEICKMYTDK